MAVLLLFWPVAATVLLLVALLSLCWPVAATVLLLLALLSLCWPVAAGLSSWPVAVAFGQACRAGSGWRTSPDNALRYGFH